MPIDLLAAKRSCTPMGARLYKGGSSSSKQTTSNVDARVVGGESSTNTSITGDANQLGGTQQRNAADIDGTWGNNNRVTASFTSTDHGAVSGALELALRGVEQANDLARDTVAASGGLLDGALRMTGEQNQQFAEALEKTKNSDVRILVGVGVAVVGLAAVTLFKKG